jgi:tetratricopeptide (TPR) repeat protein
VENWRKYVELNLAAVETGQITKPERVIQAYNAVGEFYRKNNKLAQAEEYYLQAHEYALSIGISTVGRDAVTLMNLGALYTEMSQFDKAKTQLDVAKRTFEADSLSVQLPEFYQHYARLFKKTGQLSEAKLYYEKALEWANKVYNQAEADIAAKKLAELSQTKA